MIYYEKLDEARPFSWVALCLATVSAFAASGPYTREKRAGRFRPALFIDSTPVTMGKREGKVTALFGGAHHDVDFVAVFYAGGILGHLVVDDDSHSAGGGNVGRVELGGQQHVGQRGLRLG